MYESLWHFIKWAGLSIKDNVWGNVSAIRSEQTAHQPYIRQQAQVQLASQLVLVSSLITCLNPESPLDTVEQGWDESIQYAQDNQPGLNEPASQALAWLLTCLVAAPLGSTAGNYLGRHLYNLWTATVSKCIDQSDQAAWSAQDRALHEDNIIFILNNIKRQFITFIDKHEHKNKPNDSSHMTIVPLNESASTNSVTQAKDMDLLNFSKPQNASLDEANYHTDKARYLHELMDIAAIRKHTRQSDKQKAKDQEDEHNLLEQSGPPSPHDKLSRSIQRLQEYTKEDYPMFYQFIMLIIQPQQCQQLEQSLLMLQRFMINKKQECQAKYSSSGWDWQKYQTCLQVYGDIVQPRQYIKHYYDHKIKPLMVMYNQYNDALNNLSQDLHNATYDIEVNITNTQIEEDNFQKKDKLLQLLEGILENQKGKVRFNFSLAQSFDPLMQDKQTFQSIYKRSKQLDHQIDFKSFNEQLKNLIEETCHRINNHIVKRLQKEEEQIHQLSNLLEPLEPIINWLHDNNEYTQAASIIDPREAGQKTAQQVVNKRYPESKMKTASNLEQDRQALYQGINDIMQPEIDQHKNEAFTTSVLTPRKSPTSTNQGQ